MCIGGRLWGRCCRPLIHIKHQLVEPPKPVPLAGVVVSTKIVDFVAEVTIHQRFENIEDVPIEAVYEFPLVEGASVCNFYAIVEGKKIQGKIKEKERAKDDYDDAIAAGNSVYLLEEVSDKQNVFKTSIGNLPPKEEVIITIVYVSELVFTDDKKLEFVLPTNTQAYPDGIQVPRFFQPTRPMPKTTEHIIPPYGLKVDISLDMTSKIKSISSPSHPIEFNAGDTPNTASVTLANQDDVGVPLVKNFEMRVNLANPDTPVFRVQENVGMLALYPDLLVEDEDPITEMIFVVDRSGSMAGAKIQRVIDTLQIFLRSLPLGTLFNIVGFGSDYVPLFPYGSKEYDDATLAEATKHVQELKANLGGTSLLPPLKYICSQKPREGIPRQIFVLTDGEVNNTQECITFVRSQSETSRVFAFGIHGASPELVNGIAKAGEGKAEIILGNENIEGKVMLQLRRALQPALTDMKVNWGSLVAEQTPYKLPPLFSGSRVIVYGYLGEKAEPGKIVFTAQSVNGEFKIEHEVTAEQLKPVSGINFIPKLAARSMIRDLEEGRSAADEKKMSAKQINEKIIKLSIKSGMLSKLTAFIAVNENNTAIESTMQTRDVNALTKSNAVNKKKGGVVLKPMISGYGGGVLTRSSSSSTSSSVDGSGQKLKMKRDSVPKPQSIPAKSMALNTSARSRGAPMAPSSHVAPAAPSKAMKETSSSVGPFQALSRRSARLEVDEDEKKREVVQAPSAGASGLKDIILQQKAAGNFTEDSLKLAGGSLEQLRTKVPAEITAIPANVLDQLLITIFICGILRTKYKGESDQWTLVEKKALAWVKKEAKKNGEQFANFNWAAFAVTLTQ